MWHEMVNEWWDLCFKKLNVSLWPFFTMVKTKELCEETRNAIIGKHKRSKGYKTISKELGIPVSTVRNVVKKYLKHGTVRNLPGRGGKRKINDRCLRRLVRLVEKSPHSTSTDLQANLEQSGVTVSKSTIRRTLNKVGLCGRRPRKTPLLKKKHKKDRLDFAKENLDQPQSFWQNKYLNLIWPSSWVEAIIHRLGAVRSCTAQLLPSWVRYDVWLTRCALVKNTWLGEIVWYWQLIDTCN